DFHVTGVQTCALPILERRLESAQAAIRQRDDELSVVNSVQRGLLAELDIQAIYDLVGDRIRDLFDAQAVVIRTYDLDEGLEHYQIGRASCRERWIHTR